MFKQLILAALALMSMSKAQTTTTSPASSRTTTIRTSTSTGPLAAYAYGGQLAYLQSLTTDPAYTSATLALANDAALPAYTRLSIAIALPELAIFTGTKVDAEVASILSLLPSDIASVQKSVIDKAHSIASYYQTGTTPLPGIGLGIFDGVVATFVAGGGDASAASASQDAAISSILASLTATTSTGTATAIASSGSTSGLLTSRVGSSSSASASASTAATRNAAVGMEVDRSWVGAGMMAGGLALGVVLL